MPTRSRVVNADMRSNSVCTLFWPGAFSIVPAVLLSPEDILALPLGVLHGLHPA